ncbi:MAG: hypothetical protein AAF433_18930 [Bacteroidota bacterium]
MSKLGNPRVRAGQLAQGVRQLVLIAIALWLPRLEVGLEAIGWWEQFQYLGYLLGFSWLTGLGQAYLVRLRDLDTPAANRLTAQVMTTILAISLTILLLGVLLQGPLLQFLTGDSYLPGWLFFLCFLAAHWPGLLAEQVLLARARPMQLISYSLLTNAALLAAVILPLYFGYSFETALPYLLGVALLKFLLTLMFLRPWLDFRAWVRQHWRKWLLVGSPLVIYAALNALNLSFDAWFVNFWYEGDDDRFAIFRYGTRELPLLAAATNGISQAVLPILSTSAGLASQRGLQQLKNSSLRLMHLFFPVAILLLLSSPYWWTWVFTEQLADSLSLFQVFLLLGISRMLFPIPVMTALGLGRELMIVGLIEIGINAVLSIMLVQSMGLIGVVWATVITYLLDKLVAVFWLWRRRGVPISAYCAWEWLLGYSLVLLGVYWVVGQ